MTILPHRGRGTMRSMVEGAGLQSGCSTAAHPPGDPAHPHSPAPRTLLAHPPDGRFSLSAIGKTFPHGPAEIARSCGLRPSLP